MNKDRRNPYEEEKGGVEFGVNLSRRERQIMDVVYAHGEVSASDVVVHLPDPPSRTAVRTFLRILEEKQYLTHTKRGREYVYKSTHVRKRVGQTAIQRVLRTFFDGSIEDALAAHMSDPNSEISAEELARLAKLIDKARRDNV